MSAVCQQYLYFNVLLMTYISITVLVTINLLSSYEKDLM